MENLYNVMLNQLYPRAAEAGRLAEEATQMARQCSVDDSGMQKLINEIWKRIKFVDEFEDSIALRLIEMVNDEAPDPDGYRAEAIRELLNMGYRVRGTSRELINALKMMTDKLSGAHEKCLRERAQTKFQLDEMERLLRNERERRMERR